MANLPPIRGEVPAGYDGPVYYRMAQAGWAPFKYPFTVKDRRAQTQLWSMNNAGRRIYSLGNILDRDGGLLPEWQVPVQARLRPGYDNRLGFMQGLPCTLVSDRAHDEIKRFAPESIFVPVDAIVEGGSSVRYYYYYTGNSELYYALDLMANNIDYSLYRNGDPLYACPGWLKTEKFGFLDASKIEDRHLIVNGCTGFVFSKALLEALGSIFPKKQIFHPIGIA